MKQKILFISFLFLLVLVLASCSRLPGKSSSTSTSKDFNKGTEALAITFLETPQKESYERSSFILGINLNNKGSQDITDAVLSISTEDDFVSLTKENWRSDLRTGIEHLGSNKIRFNLEGKNIYNPLGEQGILYLTPETKTIQENSYETTIGVTSCYLYKTEAVPTVCIDPGSTSNRKIKEKSCIQKEITLDSQGAPISVTKVETTMTPRGTDFLQPTFMITIENKGNGDVTIPDKSIVDSLCGVGDFSTEQGKEIYNAVKLRAYLSRDLDKQLTCTPEGEDAYTALVQLTDKKGAATCTLQQGISAEDPTYTTTLQIVLEYGYKTTISKKIPIIKASK